MFLKKTAHILTATILAFTPLGNTAFAIEETLQENVVSVLGENNKQSLKIDAEILTDGPSFDIEALTGLNEAIKLAVANGVCKKPQNMNDAFDCVLNIAKDQNVLSLKQTLILKIASSDSEYNLAAQAILLDQNPEMLEEYGNEQEKETLQETEGMKEKQKLAEAFETYAYPDESMETYGAIEFEKHEHFKPTEESDKQAALAYALMQNDEDAIAYTAINNPQAFLAYATEEEQDTAMMYLNNTTVPDISIFADRYGDTYRDIRDEAREANEIPDIAADSINVQKPLGAKIAIGMIAIYPFAALEGLYSISGISKSPNYPTPMHEQIGAYLVAHGLEGIGSVITVGGAMAGAAIWSAASAYELYSEDPSRYIKRKEKNVQEELDEESLIE